MFQCVRSRLSYANVISTICLFLLLGGGAYAAFKLPKSSVGTKQLKKGSVTTAKLKHGAVTTSKLRHGAITDAQIKAGSLTAGVFAPGQLPTAPLFVNSDQNGTIRASSPGATVTKMTSGPDTFYRVTFSQDLSNCAPVATIGPSSGGGVVTNTTMTVGIGSGGADSHGLTVEAVNNTSNLGVAAGFGLAVVC